MRLLVLAVLVACHPPGYDKHQDIDAGEVDAPAIVVDAPVAAATCTKSFRLDGHGSAQSVWLSGEFVSWAPTPSQGAVVFTRDAGGGWTGSYAFAAGQHTYKFIVDGNTWILDPTNPMTMDDGMGNTNSVYVCTPST